MDGWILYSIAIFIIRKIYNYILKGYVYLNCKIFRKNANNLAICLKDILKLELC